MTTPLRAAVVGVGYLGAFHAEKYASLPDVDLVAVVDTDLPRAQTAAARVRSCAATDYRTLFGRVDCVSLAVPTPLHFALAQDLVAHGIDVLVEEAAHRHRGRRPRARRRGAEHAGRILQVGPPANASIPPFAPSPTSSRGRASLNATGWPRSASVAPTST